MQTTAGEKDTIFIVHYMDIPYMPTVTHIYPSPISIYSWVDCDCNYVHGWPHATNTAERKVFHTEYCKYKSTDKGDMDLIRYFSIINVINSAGGGGCTPSRFSIHFPQVLISCSPGAESGDGPVCSKRLGAEPSIKSSKSGPIALEACTRSVLSTYRFPFRHGSLGMDVIISEDAYSCSVHVL
jgi:hypothetical protein